jgi:hypothetical protein
VLSVECLMIQLSPSQEIGNLKPKTWKPQTKTQLDWVFLKESPPKKEKTPSDFHVSWKLGFFWKNHYKMWMIFIILQSWDPWKNLKEKCNQFPYFENSSFFEETSKQIQGNFLQTCCTSNFFYQEPHAFSDVKSGVRAKIK